MPVNFASLMKSAVDFLNFGKLVSHGVPGIVLTVGVMLLVDFPMPSFIQQRRPVHYSVPTIRVDTVLQSVEVTPGDTLSDSLVVAIDRPGSSPVLGSVVLSVGLIRADTTSIPDSIGQAAYVTDSMLDSLLTVIRRDSIDAQGSIFLTLVSHIWSRTGPDVSVNLTVRKRDSIIRGRVHREFRRTMGDLASLVIRDSAVSREISVINAIVQSHIATYNTRFAENSLLARTARQKLREEQDSLAVLESTAARLANSVAVARQDSARIAAEVARVDAGWDAFNEAATPQSFVDLITTLVLIAILGYAVGAILDPVNKALILPRRSGPDEETTMMHAIGRGLLTTDDHEYLVTHYYRYVELSIGLVMPTFVLAFGVAHAVPPLDGARGLVFAVLAFLIALALTVGLLLKRRCDDEGGPLTVADANCRIAWLNRRIGFWDGKLKTAAKAVGDALASQRKAQEALDTAKDDTEEEFLASVYCEKKMADDHVAIWSAENVRAQSELASGVSSMVETEALRQLLSDPHASAKISPANRKLVDTVYWRVARVVAVVAVGVYVVLALVTLIWEPGFGGLRLASISAALAVAWPAACLLVCLSRRRYQEYKSKCQEWIAGAEAKVEAAKDKTNEELLKKVEKLLTDNQALLKKTSSCKHGMPASVLLDLKALAKCVGSTLHCDPGGPTAPRPEPRAAPSCDDDV